MHLLKKPADRGKAGVGGSFPNTGGVAVSSQTLKAQHRSIPLGGRARSLTNVEYHNQKIKINILEDRENYGKKGVPESCFTVRAHAA
jgi:hypothetical protein